MNADKPYMDIELFPCAGGMAKGFKDAGVEFDLAIELLENHCDSYEANLGHRPVQMDARSFLELLQSGWLPPKPVRMVVADPPCTPWSRAGKRMGTDDPRDMLEGTCRIISYLKPSVYLIGNVPGLDDGPNLHIVQKHIGGLNKFGYCTADFARLDAANYGVPQHRIRPFWFGHRINVSPCIVWPLPTHCDPDDLGNLTLPGVDELLPWITCRQALGHLSPEELGRPIKLRKRTQNSKQHGSVAEKPARVVGTSNLSDGNVLLGDSAPRAGKKGQRQLNKEALMEDWNESGPKHDYTKPLELQDQPPAKGGPRKRDRERISQALRTGNMDKPSVTLTAKAARKGAGAHAVFTIQPERGQTLSTMDAPAPAVLRNTHGNASILVVTDKHPASSSEAPSHAIPAHPRQGQIVVNDKHRPVGQDEPSGTIRSGGNGHSAPPVVISMEPHHPPGKIDEPSMTIRAGSGGGANRCIQTSSNHPASKHDSPSNTIRASDGEGSNRALEWPWQRPSTTVLGDERLPPPGHHGDSYLAVDGDGIVISEKAAAILQGFPEDWKFIGESKKKRWSQIGQAMPPPLAYAVATSVVTQIEKTRAMAQEESARRIAERDRKRDTKNYQCTHCGERMERWEEFEEFQHADCGGLVKYTPIVEAPVLSVIDGGV